ncbi:MAG: Gfo/Idh/MocA family oxidoreductase [Candidatus Latescibacterota bacterium]
MDKVRIGILGTGGIAGAHLTGYKVLRDAGYDGFVLSALCDNSAERRAAFAAKVKEQLGVSPQQFGSAEAMAASGAVDAADICTPHAFHHTTAIPCLEAGLDVMVEKPCGITIRASDLIIAAAQRQGRLVAVAEQVRRGVKARAMNWAVNEARMIGDIRFWSVVGFSFSDFGAASYRDAYAWQWRLLKLLTGGGMLFDAGAHFADMMLHLFGPVEEVYACTRAYQQPALDSPELGPQRKDVEDTWISTWRFANGILGQYTWSFSAPGEPVATQIFYGTGGSARDRGGWMHTFQNGADLTLADGTKVPYEQIEPRFRAQLDEGLRQRFFPCGVENDMALECWDFVDSVLKRRKPEISAEDTRRAKAACLAVYESATLGAPVKVQDVLEGKVSAYQDPVNEHWRI